MKELLKKYFTFPAQHGTILDRKQTPVKKVEIVWLMRLTVQGNQQDAVIATVKRQISFVPYQESYGRVYGFCPLTDADKVLAWFEESGHGELFDVPFKKGTLVSYEWPEEN